MDYQFIFQFVSYLLGLAATAGTIITRVNALDKKVEKHNNLIERMYVVEERSKSNTHRLDKLEKDIKSVEEDIKDELKTN